MAKLGVILQHPGGFRSYVTDVCEGCIIASFALAMQGTALVLLMTETEGQLRRKERQKRFVTMGLAMHVILVGNLTVGFILVLSAFAWTST